MNLKLLSLFLENFHGSGFSIYTFDLNIFSKYFKFEDFNHVKMWLS